MSGQQPGTATIRNKLLVVGRLLMSKRPLYGPQERRRGMATPMEEEYRRTQNSIASARLIREAAAAQREQAIIDREVAITMRQPDWMPIAKATVVT